MDSLFEKAATVGAERYYIYKLGKNLEYGTAGFRDKGSALACVTYRMGLLAVLRSQSKNGATVGVMVTASHNPEEDNGVKICDPMGEMLESHWETYATEVVNADAEELPKCLQRICDANSIDQAVEAHVFLARDTRSSSPNLAAAVAHGVKILNGILHDYGILTTPQLHYMVRCKNTNRNYGLETAEGYYTKFSSAYQKLNIIKEDTRYVPHVFVDGANGVGALALNQLIPYIKSSLTIEVFNAGSTNLNCECGADYVKVQQKAPRGANIVAGQRYASLDGDADRLIYFYLDSDKFCILDGDKIATLLATYLMKILGALDMSFQIRVVQTAYANSSSTRYIENSLKIPTVQVPTGVKYLHKEASKHDIGIYFEANGHGTILFDQKIKEKVKGTLQNTNISDSVKSNCEKLLHVIDLTNEAVGDAIADLLLVETALRDLDWSVSDWHNVYHDLPNRQLKVKVADRDNFSTDAQMVCTKPKGFQNQINSAVASYKDARAFVRPSGTENIIRVYAEADTQENADALAKSIADRVKQLSKQ